MSPLRTSASSLPAFARVARGAGRLVASAVVGWAWLQLAAAGCTDERESVAASSNAGSTENTHADAASPPEGGDDAKDALSEALPDLTVYGVLSLFELTPVVLAADRYYPGRATVSMGNVADLTDETGGDLAANAETQVLRASIEHPELRIVFTLAHGFYRIVARRSAGIQQLSDLAGKRVATSTSTSGHYFLEQMLASVGLSGTDVTFVPPAIGLTNLPELFENDETDAAAGWEPQPQIVLDQLGDDGIEFQDRSLYRELYNLITTESVLANADKRRAIVAFVRALISASRQLRDAPEEIWPLVAATTGYDPALIAKSWQNEGFPGTLDDGTLDLLEDQEVWLAPLSLREPRSRGELARLIDDSVLREALATP